MLIQPPGARKLLTVAKNINRTANLVVDSILRGFIHGVLFFSGRLRVTGRDNVPSNGPYIMVVNHMSKADPPLVMIAMPRVRMRFFAAEKWKKHMIFGPLLRWGGGIFINRGEVDRAPLREALKALQTESVFGLAPEGTRSRVGALIRARDGAAYLATRSKVTLLPVSVVNTDILGHNMARLRKTDIQINIGKPFTLPELQQRPKGAELSANTHLIMVHIAAMLPERHRGYYAESPALKAYLEGEDPWPYCLEAEGVETASV
jgi:1-acyl-sn-glycerol-3-phosphate acyltransferase